MNPSPSSSSSSSVFLAPSAETPGGQMASRLSVDLFLYYYLLIPLMCQRIVSLRPAGRNRSTLTKPGLTPPWPIAQGSGRLSTQLKHTCKSVPLNHNMGYQCSSLSLSLSAVQPWVEPSCGRALPAMGSQGGHTAMDRESTLLHSPLREPVRSFVSPAPSFKMPHAFTSQSTTMTAPSTFAVLGHSVRRWEPIGLRRRLRLESGTAVVAHSQFMARRPPTPPPQRGCVCGAAGSSPAPGCKDPSLVRLLAQTSSSSSSLR